MQQHFWGKDSLQGVPNQDGKSRKFHGVAGCDKHPMEWKFRGGGGLKQKCPPLGGRGIWIFSGTTQSLSSTVVVGGINPALRL